MKHTPLFAAHQKLGGKLIEFGGWEMPVHYTSIMDEHQAVRKAAGLFDISHMGEVLISGPGAEAFLNQTLTNDIRKLAPGQGQYTLVCNERGGVVDDLPVKNGPGQGDPGDLLGLLPLILRQQGVEGGEFLGEVGGLELAGPVLRVDARLERVEFRGGGRNGGGGIGRKTACNQEQTERQPGGQGEAFHGQGDIGRRSRKLANVISPAPRAAS